MKIDKTVITTYTLSELTEDEYNSIQASLNDKVASSTATQTQIDVANFLNSNK